MHIPYIIWNLAWTVVLDANHNLTLFVQPDIVHNQIRQRKLDKGLWLNNYLLLRRSIRIDTGRDK